MSNPSNPLEDQSFMISQSLGEPLIPAEVNSIRSARRDRAANELTALFTNNSEFERRQGSHNMDFVYSVLESAPGFAVDCLTLRTYHDVDLPTSSRRVTNEFTSSYSEDLGLAGLGSAEMRERVSRLTGMRASTVWIERNLRDVFSEVGDYPKKTSVPYLMIGHKYHNNSETSVLFVPLFDLGDVIEKNGAYSIEVPTTDNRSFDGNISYEHISLDRHILEARMHTNQFSTLRALQDSLSRTGLKPKELASLYDQESGVVTLGAESHLSIKATTRKKLPRRIRGASKYGLGPKRPFDVVVGERITDRISPDKFRDFSVLSDLHRAAIILGIEEAYVEARGYAEKMLLEDPVTKLLNDT